MRRTDRFRLVLMGVTEKYQNRGIEAAFYATVVENALRLGFREAEMSNIVETK